MLDAKLEAELGAWMNANRESMLKCLRTLVAIDTQNFAPDGNERTGPLVVAAMLRELGGEVDVYQIQSVSDLTKRPRYWDERPCIGRPNVTVRFVGRGGRKSLLFFSYIDTVGSDAWSRQPWGELNVRF